MIYTIILSGISHGQSIQMWHEYFPNSQIYGVDIRIKNIVRKNLAPLKRAHLFQFNAYNDKDSIDFFRNNSMDVIIDDAVHHSDKQETMLENFWRCLKPGGLYIIEDIEVYTNTLVSAGHRFIEHPSKLNPFTKEVFQNNNVVFINTAIGHRNWENFEAITICCKNLTNIMHHNSYMIIIYKRIGPVPEIKSNLGKVAMRDVGIIPSVQIN